MKTYKNLKKIIEITALGFLALAGCDYNKNQPVISKGICFLGNVPSHFIQCYIPSRGHIFRINDLGGDRSIDEIIFRDGKGNLKIYINKETEKMYPLRIKEFRETWFGNKVERVDNNTIENLAEEVCEECGINEEAN